MNSLEFIDNQIEMLIEYIDELKEDIDKNQRLLEASGDPLNAYAIKSTKETISYIQIKIKNFKQLKTELEAYDELKTPKKPRVEKVLWAKNSTSEQYIENHYCPECGEPLNKFTHNYCNKCGIKIDWSDDNEENNI